ncbi:sugar ABC transporter substrate-binding protein [Serinibacter arcticus]|uniref:Sugar ABC transporter substrate-binding protein n=1 Tax=Serinibacter arcticus TaxID=1655435 RepID=A0A2U1ZSA9_9MICO|nr:sugar ABC transporter substrate-binding protein [Serinibacter arcticus]PWD49874.1 sugar ABC transporter substrate-binding protein [Serinibacter arcticus]
MTTTSHARRRVAAATLAAAVGLTLAACSPGGSDGDAGGGDASAEALDAALEEGGELTYWTWTPAGEAQAEAFMAEHPNVTVEVVNAGTATDQYTTLQNAIQAGSGAPDVAQIEYYAIQQFSLTDGLLDLTPYGFGDLEDDYTASTWESVSQGGGIFGLPQDSGPLVMLYNAAVFEKFGLDVPATWDEYVAAGEALHAADPSRYITSDGGDPGFAQPLIWQAGGRPYQVEGDTVTVDLQDEGTQRWADMWNQLLQPGLLSDVPTWSDDWYRSLNDGSIATIITGAWMPGMMEASVPDGAGDWQVAPVPSYDGATETAENGGSAQSVIKQTDSPALAAAFLRWLNNGDGVEVFLEGGGFPATTADLNDEEFLAWAPEYFRGQEVNKVLVEASDNVASGWQYLPFQVYANSIFGDTVGSSYTSDADLNLGLTDWQQSIVSYGNEQGFTVEEGN